jgi:type IV secretion system protein VirD4
MRLNLPFNSARPKGRAPSPIGDLRAWEEANPYRLASDVHGSARFAWVTDLVRWGMFDASWGDGQGYPLGCSDFVTDGGLRTGGVIRWPHEGHRLVVGAPGSGKFTSVVAPMLLSQTAQSTIVIDPKDGEALLHTLRWRGRSGDVGVLSAEDTRDAFEAMGLPGLFLSLNPLDGLRADDPDLVMQAKRLSDALIVRVDPKHRHWDEISHRWLTATLLHVATWPNEEHRTLMRVQELVADGWPDEDLFAMLSNGAGSGIIQRAAREIEQNQEVDGEGSRLFMDVRSSLMNALQFLDAPGVRASVAESNFDPAALRQYARPITIYIVLKRENIDVHAAWLRVMYTSLVDRVARVPGREVALIVDEFAALKRFDRIPQDLATLRGAGFRLHLIVQDLNQLNGLYKESWQSIVGNCAVRQFLGVNDLFTAEYVEKLLGPTTAEKPTRDYVTPWGNEGPGYWKPDLASRALMTAGEVAHLPRTEQIIFMDGCAHPLRTYKAHYFAHEPWASRASGESGV